jgi:hypothetical protein
MNMSDIDDMPNPNQVLKDLLGRCKEAKSWDISCYVDEAWAPNGRMPFDMKIKDGIFTCRVIAATKLEAATIVGNELPVIKFIDD